MATVAKLIDRKKVAILYHMRDAKRHSTIGARCRLSPTLLQICWIGVVWVFQGHAGFAQEASEQGLLSAPPDEQEQLVRDLLSETRRELGGLKEQIDPVKSQYADLLEQVKRTGSELPARRSATEEGARTVKYRPPLARAVNKKTGVLIVCRQDRVFVFHTKEIVEAANKHRRAIQKAEQRIRKQGDKQEVLLEQSHDRFDIKLSIVGVKVLPTERILPNHQSVSLVMKPTLHGEKVSRIESSDSQFQTTINSLDPTKDMVQFAVYTDSYDVFRAARSFLWSREFDVGWNPIAPDEPVRLGGSGGPAIGN